MHASFTSEIDARKEECDCTKYVSDEPAVAEPAGGPAAKEARTVRQEVGPHHRLQPVVVPGLCS